MAGVFKSLDQSDVKLTPFRTHKLWYQDFSALWTNQNTWDDNNTWSNSGSKDNTFTIYKANYNPTPNYKLSDILNDSFDQGSPFFESGELKTSNGKFQRIVHNSIDHLYYKNFYTNNKASFGSGNINKQDRYLEDQAYVISMPQSKFGESILQNSIKLNLSWSYGVVSGSLFNSGNPQAMLSGSWSVTDDGFGNLHIEDGQFYSPYGEYVGGAYTNYSSSVTKQLVGQWPFEELHKYVDAGMFSLTSSFSKGSWQMESNYYQVAVFNKKSTAHPTPSDAELLGAMLYFSGSASSSLTIKPNVIKEYDLAYNFENEDFSISMIVIPTRKPTHPSGSVLITKQGSVEELAIDLNGNVYSQQAPNKFPYRLTYASGNNKVVFERSSGTQTFAVSSSVSMSLNTVHHIVARKSGSLLTLHVNSPKGNSTDSASLDIQDYMCRNKSNIYIGNSDIGNQGFTGYLENIKIYKDYLSDNDVKILHHTLGVGNLCVGNAFYNHGMMVLTSIPIRYSKIYNAECRGSHTIYENEISCTVNPGDFGMSSNPTLQVYDPELNQFVYSSFATSSQFKPFVTTIGLYNDQGDLLVVGKLNTPIQLPDNMDTTMIVRYDR